MPAIRLTSPAKLNLVLDVLGKRPDGFHELVTLFERISLADTITLKDRPDGFIRIICSHPHVPTGPKNLAYRIAAQLQKDYKISRGVTITIDKKIPVAAGLAGGSSNGATVLLGLNRLWHLGLSRKQLHNYATQLGSDVAFFLYNASFAIGRGRGEKIELVKAPVKLWHVLVTPKVKMYTKDVFARLRARQLATNLTLTNKGGNVNILLPFLRESNVSQVAKELSNDLEPAILSLRPDFVHLKRKLIEAKALGVCFSGSGPSVYALAQSKKHAQAIRARFDKRYTQVFVVSTF